ncbi:hypothetical protein ACHAWF_017284 [Thalassiosira exigua]
MVLPAFSLYDILSLDRNATPEQIKAAVRRLSLSLHPDKNQYGGNLMKAVNQAKDILLNESKRRKYDRNGVYGVGNNSSYADDAYINELEEKLKEANVQKKLLQTQLKSLSLKLRVKEDEIQRHQKDLRSCNETIGHFSSENKDLQNSLDNALTQNADLHGQVTALQTELTTAVSELADARISSKTLSTKLQHSEGERQQMKELVDYYK